MTADTTGERFSSMDADAQATPGGDAPPDETVLPCQRGKRLRLRIALRDAGLALYRNLDYELTVGRNVYPGNVGESGLIEKLVPPDTTRVELAVWLDDDPETLPEVWELEVGDVDPVALESGAEVRLRNLSATAGEAPSLAAFQALVGLAPTGELDEETQSHLERAESLDEEVAPTGGRWNPA